MYVFRVGADRFLCQVFGNYGNGFGQPGSGFGGSTRYDNEGIDSGASFILDSGDSADFIDSPDSIDSIDSIDSFDSFDSNN